MAEFPGFLSFSVSSSAVRLSSDGPGLPGFPSSSASPPAVQVPSDVPGRFQPLPELFCVMQLPSDEPDAPLQGFLRPSASLVLQWSTDVPWLPSFRSLDAVSPPAVQAPSDALGRCSALDEEPTPSSGGLVRASLEVGGNVATALDEVCTPSSGGLVRESLGVQRSWAVAFCSFIAASDSGGGGLPELWRPCPCNLGGGQPR